MSHRLKSVSIVVGTMNRLPLLQQMVASVCEDMRNFYGRWQFVIVDSSDNLETADWITHHKSVGFTYKKMEQQGAVAAFNAGFALAQCDFVVALNDDCIIHPPVIPVAIQMLQNDPQIGQIAIPYNVPTNNAAGHSELLLQHINVNGHVVMYANFSVMRRALGAELGWWQNIYQQYGGDTHLSIAVWNAGLKVVGLNPPGFIEHIEAMDGTRRGNGGADRLFEYWQGWEGPDRSTLTKMRHDDDDKCYHGTGVRQRLSNPSHGAHSAR